MNIDRFLKVLQSYLYKCSGYEEHIHLLQMSILHVNVYKNHFTLHIIWKRKWFLVFKTVVLTIVCYFTNAHIQLTCNKANLTLSHIKELSPMYITISCMQAFGIKFIKKCESNAIYPRKHQCIKTINSTHPHANVKFITQAISSVLA